MRWMRTTVLLTVPLILTLTSCGSPNTGSNAIGILQHQGNSSSIVVPALWASSAADGTQSGGIEPASIEVVLNASSPGYTVDLTTIEAKGAGPQWKAATAAAAAVATMAGNVDPADVSLGFTITGPIDGPSAGAILTSGLLAAMNGDSFLPGVTMTGTISPDGSIGPVGYVPTKLKAAREAGYTTVAIPASLVNVQNTAGEPVSLVDYGKELGLTVRPVQTIAEAYRVLTGQELTAAVGDPIVLSTAVVASIASTAQSMRMRLRTLVDALPQGVAKSEQSLGEQSLRSMDKAISAEDWPTAYGIGSIAFLRLTRAAGAANIQARIADVGVSAAQQELVEEIKKSLGAANATAAAGITQSRDHREQQVALPQALVWVMYAAASYEGLLEELALANSEEALIRAARILAEEQAGVEVMYPDAILVLDSIVGDSAGSPEETSSLLDDYSAFLTRAGDANLGYADVVMREQQLDGSIADDGVLAATRVLANQMKQVGPSSTLNEALTQAARAITYYELSNGLLSAHQAYGVSGQDANLDALSREFQAAMDSAVDAGAATAEAGAERAAALGSNPDFPLWSSRWGTAGARAYRGTVAAGQASWIGLNELWVGTVTLSMLRDSEERFANS